KTCLNRPADSLRCLPVTAVRHSRCTNLQSFSAKFCLFQSVLFFSDGGQRYLVPRSLTDSNSFALQGAACPCTPPPS
ncbi:MAG: hypothetical protein ACI4TG_10465, partial [Ruminococcus sp.]